MKSVHIEYVKRTFNIDGLFERTVYASYSLSLHFYIHFYYAFYGGGGGGGGWGGRGRVVDFDYCTCC